MNSQELAVVSKEIETAASLPIPNHPEFDCANFVMPEDAKEFCDREKLGDSLQIAVELAKQHFATSDDPLFQLEQEPELDNYYWSFANFPAAGRTKPQIAIPAIKTPGATRGHRGKWIMS